MKENKIIYYTDEENDEFSGISRKTKQIGKGYSYEHKIFWRIGAVILYRLFVFPFAFLFCKLKFRLKIVGKEVFKGQKEGFFMYGNHTQIPADGFFPALCLFPRRPSVVVNADNVSLRGTENLMLMLGALPLPNEKSGIRDFLNAMEKRIKNKIPVIIYPEAHIWPYYTGIRNFPIGSFFYPIKYQVPSYCITTTYQKRKGGVNITLYCDGPFYGKGNTIKEKQKDLHEQIYQTMLQRAKNSTYSKIEYIKRKQNDSDFIRREQESI